MINIVHNEKSYEFARLGPGMEGHWLHNNRICHLVLDRELTQVAKAQGLTEEHGFARKPPKPEPVKSVRVAGAGGRKRRSSTAVRIKINL